MKVEAKQLDALLHPTFDPAALKAATPITTGLPASPGAACGAVYFTADDAAKAHKTRNQGCSRPSGDPLRRISTAMAVSEGIMTARGGLTLARSRSSTRHGHLLCSRRKRHQGFRRG